MPSNFSKKPFRTGKILQDASCAASHGGQLVVDALAKDFGLWERIRKTRLIDPRKDKSRGFAPEPIVAQFVFSFCSGGISLSDAGRLGSDKALGRLVGMDRWADESTLGEWLRAQEASTLVEIWRIIREFVDWVLGKAKSSRSRPARGGRFLQWCDTRPPMEGICSGRCDV